MTKNQRKMLEVLDWWGGEGTMEAILQYGEYEPGEGESEAQAWSITKLAAGAVVRSLVRKGWATDDENGWDITEAGRDALRRTGFKCRPEVMADRQVEKAAV